MKKELIGMVAFIIIMTIIMVYGANRFERINNGQMELINQNQMDR